MSDNLLPCPFCGAGKTLFEENGKIWTGQKWSEPVSVSVQHWCQAVPGQPNRMIERVGRDLPSAIAAWNRRADRASRAVQGDDALLRQTDPQRLDWLDANPNAIRRAYGYLGAADCWTWTDRASDAPYADNIRDAIDAALRARLGAA